MPSKLPGIKILAIDPGYERLGVAIMEKGGKRERVIYSNCVITDKTWPASKRLATIKKEVERLIREYQPRALGIESLFFNKNQKTALAVAEVRGVLLCLAEEQGLEIREFTPMQVKVAVTGYGKSDKKHIAQLLPALAQFAHEPEFDDEYDAIAVGITFFARQASL